MLKKLYSYEFRALYRQMLPAYGGLMGLTLLLLIIETVYSHFSDGSNLFLNLSFAGVNVLYILGIIAVFLIGQILLVVRFYRHLLSGEGYLTFSLPFTATQHLVCKVVCGSVVILTTVLVVALSLIVQVAGISVRSLGVVDFSFLPAIFRSVSTFVRAGGGGILAELVLLLLLTPVASLLMYDTCMAIGQQFKNRILASVVAYIAMQAGLQIASTILTIPLLLPFASFLESADPYLMMTVLLGGILLFMVALSAAGFFVTRYFLTKKLNLE